MDDTTRRKRGTGLLLATAVMTAATVVTLTGAPAGAATTTIKATGATITITANGVSPTSIQVSPGARVTFVNNDTRAHNMTSNPHPEHTDCTQINQVGLLTPGQSRETGNLTTARTCGFHDHDLPSVANLTGSIVIR